MATMNFSVPDEVKQAFDETFKGRNKSAILTSLMRQAIVDVERVQRRERAAREILEARTRSDPVSTETLHEARQAGRP